MSRKNLNAKKIPKVLDLKLKNRRINQIYKKFEKSLNINENFIVAVSGGPDSLALSFLSKIYSIKRNLKVKYYIVDHRLRAESTYEAKIVKKILKKNSIDSNILTLKGRKPNKNIQSLARQKRYKLLFAKCKQFKINHILLGHHLDDLFENFFIRLVRGSGLRGLISLDKKNKKGLINLNRPLLDQKKSDLIFLSNKIFEFYIKDPSNEKDKFLRIKIRKLITNLQKDGLDKNKLSMTIDNLKRSNNVIDFYVSENLKKNTFFSLKKDHLILNKKFFQQPYEVVFRAFSDSIQFVGKKYYPARGKKLDRIISDIENDKVYKSTLGGCVIEKVNQTVIISREY
ncbi:MAG: tRNA lysidine(34) synthetase TilS [Pelagibacterales bacterium MED-G41]|nr:MAG: tRNA lysidine(34) synthetase TilS [Pelagibacterales bacterium MED-G41]|tara:strand:+ start:173 stop:1198 length:1026 start_codon:yes stop_codon:yes gene_type:complete